MTWVAWRTQRAQLLAALGVTLLLALWVATTGLTMNQSQTWKYWADGAVYALYALPAIVGLGIGAPLVAGELDRRTQRLAWTQGMSRRQWLSWKIAIGAGVVVIASGLLALLIQWWANTVNIALTSHAPGPTRSTIVPPVFDATGIVIIGYTLFAFALGVALGAVIRRPGWTFAVGVPIFIAARLLMRFDARPHLLAPAIYAGLTPMAPKEPAWILQAGILPAGRTSPAQGHSWFTIPKGLLACTNGLKRIRITAWTHCLAINHLHFVVQYQPESRYWLLQGAETGIFVVVALVVLGLAILGVERVTG